jgi:broad specificity phosphatase PhoE
MAAARLARWLRLGFSEGMHLDATSLKNKYYAFRHGESRANVEGIIVSDPAIGTAKYGLSDEGRRQVEESAARLSAVVSDAVIVASDFRRTVETAEIVRMISEAVSVRLDPRMRERQFGQWEGACYTHYSDAWKMDAVDPDQEIDGVESATAVRRRMVDTVLSLEADFSDRDIVLVSHGDPLRLLQTAFEGLDTALNRTLPYFETAGWRLLNP